MLHDTRQLRRHMRVGNGGISIRHVPSMLDIIEKHRNESPRQENERICRIIDDIRAQKHCSCICGISL